ncbi:MAG: hypothetical protein HY202_08920 [Nitrospirae bacterium]|nr:hypothetical protein [Nitrospirota bacterium]MBI3606130.1 hypothetical protein [Nitrospirota bacterium]
MVELVIVIVLIGFIAMTASLLIGEAAKTYQKEDNYSAALNQGRLALERMAREIRMIKNQSAITTCTATRLDFTDIQGNAMTYNYNGTTTLTDGENTLADNLSSFSFAYKDSSGNPTAVCSSIWNITLNITPIQGGETLPLQITVHPRGF